MKNYKKIVFLGDTIVDSQPLGIQRYAFEILCELDQLILPYKVEVLIPRDSETNLKFNNIDVVCFGKIGRKGFLWRQIDFPKYVKKEHALSVDLTLGLIWSGSDIVCLHDCIHENYPDDFIGFFSKLKRYSYLFRAKMNIFKSKRIITVSETSKNELKSYYNLKNEKISVIYNGWQHIKRIKADESILKKIGLKRFNYLFSLGSQLPHKNFSWIISAAKKNPDELFVITGTRRITKYCLDYDDVNNIIFTGYLNDAEIKALMSNCKCFIFPSLYEGFGIPPLEALACGADILISNRSCLPEIYGKSAMYFDPSIEPNFDFNDICSDYIEKSVILSRYSWNKAARTLSLIISELNES